MAMLHRAQAFSCSQTSTRTVPHTACHGVPCQRSPHVHDLASPPKISLSTLPTRPCQPILDFPVNPAYASLPAFFACACQLCLSVPARPESHNLALLPFNPEGCRQEC